MRSNTNPKPKPTQVGCREYRQLKELRKMLDVEWKMNPLITPRPQNSQGTIGSKFVYLPVYSRMSFLQVMAAIMHASRIWKLKAPHGVIAFRWIPLHGGILTMDNLHH